jgi:hypothetical protein
MQVLICDASYPQPADTTSKENPLFKVYPNPASDYLVVEFENRVPSFEYSMFDMTGRLILSDCFENRMFGEIDVSGLLPGIYLIRVSDGTITEKKRIAIN